MSKSDDQSAFAEGSDERKRARRILVRSAQAMRSLQSQAAWLERIAVLAPDLVAVVGTEDLVRIADYAWG